MTYWSSIVEYIIVLSVIKPPCLLCQIDSTFSILKDLLVFYCRRPSRVLWQKTAFYFMAEDFWHSSCRRPPCHLLLKNAGFSFGPIRILVDLVWHLISGSPNSLHPPLVAEETEKNKCYSFHFHLAKRVQSNGINENENNLGSVGSKQQQQGGEGGQGGGSEKKQRGRNYMQINIIMP